MKKIAFMMFCALLSIGAFAQKKSSPKATQSAPAAAAKPMPVLKNAKDSASYAYGIVLANSLKRQMGNTDINQEIVTQTVTSALSNDSLLFTADQAQKIYNDYQKVAAMRANEVNLKAGEAFLAENKKRREVTTTPSGLQYEVMKSSDSNAPKPVATDKVKVHYHGTLVDGTVFDSSVERGAPAEFPLNGVIKGWTEGLQYMRVGDKYKLFLPYTLAYGDRAAGPKIKPYSTLIFEVELLEITTPK